MPAAKPRAVPTFYDVDESPPLLPLLSSQTEICYHPMSRVFVSANEDMTIAKLNVPQRVPILRATPAVPRASTPGPPRPSTPLVVTVTGKLPVKAVTFTSSGPSESPQSNLEQSRHSPSPSKSSLSSLESEVGDVGKIPKPNGEAGRPGRGGYNLEEQLGWGEDNFKTLKRFVNKAIKKHLDVKKCRAVQDRKALEAVQDA
ncbi:hypothetical protein PAXINDRAFT_159113, partial [Paxillus involutus ATCC 200175]